MKHSGVDVGGIETGSVFGSVVDSDKIVVDFDMDENLVNYD